MIHWGKSGNHGGIYASSLHAENYSNNSKKNIVFDFQPTAERIGNLFRTLRDYIQQTYEKIPATQKIYFSAINKLKDHISKKQEVYWPFLIALTILIFVLISRFASAKATEAPNNLPIKNNLKLNFVNFSLFDNKSGKFCAVGRKNEINITKLTESAKDFDVEKETLREDIAKIVKGTPMAAMVNSIAEKDRLVAAFIVGIAMKESKFGVYSPHIGGRDCFNYWGLKAGGKTTAGGYTCFNSPDEAVSVVGKTVEKMIARGVRSPAQAISWKCGSSCAGHGAENVRKWIVDVGINFYKIKS